MTTVVFLLAPGLHLLDLAGPAQAFDAATGSGRGYHLRYVAEREDVPTAQGLTVRAQTEWPALTADDLVIVPGWRAPALPGTGPLTADTLGRLAGHHEGGGIVASVCSGADALGRAGLLAGRRCTTHHAIQDELARRYPDAHVVRDVLYVEDGRVATSAGIASGIDLALHLIAVRDGPAVAARTAREMVVYARRNGDEQQASAMFRHRNHLSDLAHRVQDHIEARFAEPLPLAGLARASGVSERTLTRRFTAATGMTPLRYQQVLRLERAEHLIGHGATTEAAARTVGFQDPRMLRRLRARGAAQAPLPAAGLASPSSGGSACRSLPPGTWVVAMTHNHVGRGQGPSRHGNRPAAHQPHAFSSGSGRGTRPAVPGRGGCQPDAVLRPQTGHGANWRARLMTGRRAAAIIAAWTWRNWTRSTYTPMCTAA